jgi:hypothetical protein
LAPCVVNQEDSASWRTSLTPRSAAGPFTPRPSRAPSATYWPPRLGGAHRPVVEATPVGATREGFYHRILLDVGSRRQRRSDHQAAASRPDQASKALQSLIGFRVRL